MSSAQKPLYMRYTMGNFTPSEMVTDGNFMIYIIELSLLFFGVIGNIVFIIAILSTGCLHLNLRILLCNCCFAFIVMAVGRAMIAVPLCIAHITDNDISSHNWCYVANSLHHSSADAVCLSFVFIMLERCAGTIWAKNYEKTRIHAFSIIFMMLQWLLPGFMIFGSYLDRNSRMTVFQEYPHLPCQIEYLTPSMFMLTILSIAVGFLISMIGMTVLYRTNIRKYKRKDVWFNTANLSERYQISENLRSTHLLFPLLFLMLTFSLLGVIVLVYGSYWISVILEDPTSYARAATFFGRGGEAAQLFDIITAIYTTSFPICAFRCHPNLLRRFRNVLCQSSVVRPVELTEIRGFRMTTSSMKTQTDFHFHSLNQQWND